MKRAASEPHKPSLRISHIVYGRRNRGGRVEYLVDPRGEGCEYDIPENVVAIRWRKRIFPGYEFKGAHLSSTVWRALAASLGPETAHWMDWSIDDLKQRRAATAETRKRHNLRMPSPEIVRGLVDVCGPKRLAALVARHVAMSGRSGVPDLFLFARDLTGQATMGRFVEVKKPEERVSRDQMEEIAFLQDLGLQARVLRLRER